MSGVARSSYNRRGLFCNGFFADALDRLLGEALAGEVASSSRALAAGLDDAPSPHGFRLQALQSSLDVLDPDSASVEIVANEEVARAAPSEQLGTSSREPCIVDRACAYQTIDGFLACRSIDVSLEPFRELPLRKVPVGQRAGSPGKRLMSAKLVPQVSRSRPVDLDADVEPGGQHDLGWQGPPGLAFELDLDPPAGAGPQEANPWRRPSP